MSDYSTIRVINMVNTLISLHSRVVLLMVIKLIIITIIIINCDSIHYVELFNDTPDMLMIILTII